MTSDYQHLKRSLIEQGFTIELTTNGRWKVFPPDTTKDIVVVTVDASTGTAWRNAMAALRRAGFNPDAPRPVRPPPPMPAASNGQLLVVAPNGAHAHEPAPASSEGVTIESRAEATLDRAWAALKDARMYLGLVDEDLRAAAAALEHAQAEHEKVTRERAVAVEQLARAKADFDALFESNPKGAIQ
jgi:hypothetical protein